MKKTFVFTALAAACCFAQAQPTPDTLTVYGLLDAGFQSVSGRAGGTDKSLVSGIMEGSRLGVRGNEDIGNGFRALFTLESRVELDTGAVSNRPKQGSRLPIRLTSAAALGLPVGVQQAVTGVSDQIGAQIGVNHIANAIWDRQAFVGLVTPVGGILAGRQYTPAYEVVATFDTLATQSSLSAGQIASFPPAVEFRADRALAYRLVQGPISGSVMYGFGQGTSTSINRFWGLQATYRTDAFGVGIGHNQRNNELGDKALQSTALGGYVKLGPGNLGALVVRIKDDNPAGTSGISAGLQAPPFLVPAAFANAVQGAFIEALRQDAMLYQIGYRFTTGPSTVYVAYNQFNDKRASNADVKSYGLAYTYALSKRTDINAVLTRFDNSANAQAAPGQAGFLGGVTASPGTDSTSVALGIRHRF